VFAHKVRKRAFGRKSEAGPADVHDFEDLGGVNPLSAGHVIEQTQHGVTARELAQGLGVLKVSQSPHPQGRRALEVASFGLHDAPDEPHFE
jgi:hypothetical protein